MTLFKQLALAISLIIITILASVLAINYESSKKQMLESMYQTTVNNISTLSHKLAEAENDEILVETIIDAEFSSGYYQKISYKGYDPEFEYSQEYKERIESVPAWFIELSKLELQSVKTDVSAQWNILGELKVTGDNGIIYKSLYKIFTELAVLFVVFVALSLLILSIMLRFILKPLKKIQQQAEAIIKNEFIIEESSPFTSEFKEVSRAMNSMVQKVEEIFKQANEASKKNHELLYTDQVTKLANKRYLLLKLFDTIQLETKVNGGSIMMVGLSDAEVLNKRFSRQIADKIFLAFGENLHTEAKKFDDNIVARMNGTEFCLVLPGCDLENADNVAQKIYADFLELIEEYELTPHDININIGIYKYRPNITAQELLQHAEKSLLEAKAADKTNIYLNEDQTHEIKTKEEWRVILDTALKNQQFQLKFWNCIDAQTTKSDHKVMTFLIDDGDTKYFYGDFIAAAIALGISSKIYTHILEKIFTTELEASRSNTYSIRLSNDFLKDPATFIYLEELFKKYAKSSNYKFIFEISNAFCTNNTLLANGYSQLFKKYNFALCINAFTNESSDLSYLKTLSPEIIKADVSFLLDLSTESIHSLMLVTNSLNIHIIATMVKDLEQLNHLKKVHIQTIQGPLTDQL